MIRRPFIKEPGQGGGNRSGLQERIRRMHLQVEVGIALLDDIQQNLANEHCTCAEMDGPIQNRARRKCSRRNRHIGPFVDPPGPVAQDVCDYSVEPVR